ncbi:ABC transporter ATP-binding protein [Kineosporia succinea]|uniref:ABC-2 type transport system ATP-binding protein n=1 Tax=Kineosporia succinea TaxID=84632 RepID=A0ABT9P611_9ACTN|nr:ABC transporter ATP-binding protein [Kineosporia succinea]MDP9828001.1 ABC-2 type transport system ATP-binding protein [Kineosporia succinea]
MDTPANSGSAVVGFATDPTTPSAIVLEGLTKTFGTVTAVNGLDLRIGAGEVVAFLGPNGAGKTSTIDMLLGLSRPDGGSVKVFGLDPAEAVAQGRIAAVMQTGGLLKDLTVRETVQLNASLYREARPVREVLERAGIEEIAGRRVGKCSGGEQQRLRFALALLPEPDLLVLDEPTTGMDVEARRAFWGAIRQDAAAGRTILFATHYLDEADAYADRIVMIRKGAVVADGTASQIRGMASGRQVRAVLPGADQVALAALPGVTSVQQQGDSVTLRCNDSDAVLRYLVTRTDAHDFEVTSRNLEDAFIALTTS